MKEWALAVPSDAGAGVLAHGWGCPELRAQQERLDYVRKGKWYVCSSGCRDISFF
jgi:hypothetical protein